MEVCVGHQNVKKDNGHAQNFTHMYHNQILWHWLTENQYLFLTHILYQKYSATVILKNNFWQLQHIWPKIVLWNVIKLIFLRKFLWKLSTKRKFLKDQCFLPGRFPTCKILLNIYIQVGNKYLALLYLWIFFEIRNVLPGSTTWM